MINNERAEWITKQQAEWNRKEELKDLKVKNNMILFEAGVTWSNKERETFYKILTTSSGLKLTDIAGVLDSDKKDVLEILILGLKLEILKKGSNNTWKIMDNDSRVEKIILVKLKELEEQNESKKIVLSITQKLPSNKPAQHLPQVLLKKPSKSL